MLTVKTALAPSKIHGMGCYAAQDIEVNTLVWRFIPHVDQAFKKAEILALPHYVQAFLYPYIWKSRSQTDCFCMYADNARYINHSETPNLQCIRAESKGGYFALAKRVIREGEELTWNYYQFDDIDSSTGNLWDKIRINCGIEADQFVQEYVTEVTNHV